MSQAVPIDFDTTEDRLLNRRVRLRQPAAGYRAAIDPVLLAAAVPAQAGARVCELGAGAGAAALCLLARVPDCQVVGVERDRHMLGLAEFNAALNGVADRLSFVAGDVAALPAAIASGAFDHVVANPPYLEPERADLRSAVDRRGDAARIESTAKLATWLDAMFAAVKPKGRLTLICRADRLDELLAGLAGRAGEIVVFPLWPKPGRAAKRVLVTARAQVATPLRLAAGLVLHDESGAYTPAARAILEDAAALIL